MRKKRGAELRSEKSPQLKLERIAHILDLSSCGHKGGGVAHAHMAWPIHNYIGGAPAPGTTLNGAPHVYAYAAWAKNWTLRRKPFMAKKKLNINKIKKKHWHTRVQKCERHRAQRIGSNRIDIDGIVRGMPMQSRRWRTEDLGGWRSQRRRPVATSAVKSFGKLTQLFTQLCYATDPKKRSPPTGPAQPRAKKKKKIKIRNPGELTRRELEFLRRSAWNVRISLGQRQSQRQS